MSANVFVFYWVLGWVILVLGSWIARPRKGAQQPEFQEGFGCAIAILGLLISIGVLLIFLVAHLRWVQ